MKPICSQTRIDCPICSVVDDGPFPMAGPNVKYFIGPGTFAGIDRKTTVRLIRQGAAEFDQVSGINLRESDRSGGSRIKIFFDDDLGALGKAWTSGRVGLNSGRLIKDIDTIRNGRIIPGLVCHEFGHVFGLKHGNERLRIMHPDLGLHWGPSEIAELQRRYGPPESGDKTYWPTLRAEIGADLRQHIEWMENARASWREIADKRDAFIAKNQWANVHAVQPAVKRRHDGFVHRLRQVQILHNEWWSEHNLWMRANLPGVGRPNV